MRAKRFFSILLIVFVLSSFSLVPTAAESAGITVKVDGIAFSFPDDQQPYFSTEGRTMVPLRFVSVTLGATVDYNNNLKAAFITKKDIVVKITPGSNKASVNNTTKNTYEEKIFDSSSIVKNNVTYVPIRFISELLGVGVSWDNKTKTVFIDTTGKTSDSPAGINIAPAITVLFPPAILGSCFAIKLSNVNDYPDIYNVKIEFTNYPQLNSFKSTSPWTGQTGITTVTFWQPIWDLKQSSAYLVSIYRKNRPTESVPSVYSPDYSTDTVNGIKLANGMTIKYNITISDGKNEKVYPEEFVLKMLQ